MVTAVSGFIEQVGSMIKEFQNKVTIHPKLPSIQSYHPSTDTCQQANLYQFIGNYPIQNWISASRWMHMNWYMLGSKHVFRLAL